MTIRCTKVGAVLVRKRVTRNAPSERYQAFVTGSTNHDGEFFDLNPYACNDPETMVLSVECQFAGVTGLGIPDWLYDKLFGSGIVPSDFCLWEFR